MQRIKGFPMMAAMQAGNGETGTEQPAAYFFQRGKMLGGIQHDRKGGSFTRRKFQTTQASYRTGVFLCGTIADKVFSGCSSLQEITIRSTTIPTQPTSSSARIPNTVTIYVPSELLESYKSNTQWSYLKNTIKSID